MGGATTCLRCTHLTRAAIVVEHYYNVIWMDSVLFGVSQNVWWSLNYTLGRQRDRQHIIRVAG